MPRTIAALFEDRGRAEGALQALLEAGIAGYQSALLACRDRHASELAPGRTVSPDEGRFGAALRELGLPEPDTSRVRRGGAPRRLPAHRAGRRRHHRQGDRARRSLRPGRSRPPRRRERRRLRPGRAARRRAHGRRRSGHHQHRGAAGHGRHGAVDARQRRGGPAHPRGRPARPRLEHDGDRRQCGPRSGPARRGRSSSPTAGTPIARGACAPICADQITLRSRSGRLARMRS